MATAPAPRLAPAPTCPICAAAVDPETAEHADVRCNVRKFRAESFRVYRCPSCRSLHAADPVDLDHYYAGYPIFSAELDWKLDVVYASMLRRLRKAGLRPEHRILDFGCGSGALVKYLVRQGYTNTKGYDAFAPAYKDPRVLEERYDCVVSQDVIEHAEDPLAFLARLKDLVDPGGFLAIGTPDADAIDLEKAGDFIHTLHQPYHRHIFSSQALRRAAEALGLTVESYYDTMFNNTLVPTMNPRFVLHYVRVNDDCFDLITEEIRTPPALFTPKTLFFALFGYFFDRHTDVMFVLRA